MTEGGEARRGKKALSLSGGHLCHACGHQYPNPNPSAKLRRSHRRNCRRPTPEPAAAAGERNAGEGRLVLGGGPGDGKEPVNGAVSGVNGGSASPGSAEGGGGSSEDKENADEGNGTNLARPCTNVIQHKVPKTFTESAPLAVAHPVEREDSFEEYQDASSFLHQSDPEDGAALAHESDIPTEIKNLDKSSVGTSVAADVISVEMGLCKNQFSSEPSMPDFPDASKVQIEAECHLGNITPGLVAREDGLVLQSTDECSADIGSNDTDVVVDSTENTCADCSMERSSQSLSVQGTDVQLPVDNSCLVNSACSVPGYQNGLAVTNVNGMLKSIAEDNYNKGNLVKGSELDSSCEGRPRQDVGVVTVAEGNTSSEKHNGFCTEEVCNRESYTEVPTMYQVSSSQEHVTLLMDQVSSIKNPFTLDDTRSEDLFELASGNYHFEARNVVESKQQIDSTTLTGSNQTSVADRQHYPISDDRDHMLAVSNENGYAVGAEDVSVSSSADPTKNIFFHDASVNHNNQECESHTNGTSCVTSQAFSTEFGTLLVSQEINALSTYVGEKIETEYTDAKDMAAVESIDNFEENKQTEDASAEELNSVLHTDNVEEEKLAEENGVKEAVAENNQSGAAGSREARAVQSTESVHENDQTEDGSAKMATEFNTDNADNMQTGGTSKEEEMHGVQHEDNDEEKKQAEETSAKETNASQSTDSVEEQKQTQRTVGLEGSKPDAEIAAIGSRMNSARISVPLKVLLAEASLESKEKKPSTKERVLSFRRRPSSKDDNLSAKPGSAGLDDHYWNSPAKLPHGRNVNKRSKVRKQPWMPFICCHSVH